MLKFFGKLIVVICMVVLFGTFSGCDKSGPDEAKGSKYLVIFSQCNNAEPYRNAQNKMMAKLWTEKGDVDFEIMDAQQDNSKQISQIETAVLRKPDLLIVAPNERAPLTNVMGKAMEAKIPTICLERNINKPNYDTFIGCDNRVIGRLAGKFIVNYLTQKYSEPKGKIVEIRGLLGVEGETYRYDGAHEHLDKHAGIKVVQDGIANWLQSKGRERMTEILRAQPEIDVVYGHNDPMAIGAYLAAKELGREKEMIFIGVDGLGGPAGGIKKVQDGILAATFMYPLCVTEAVEIGNQMLREESFKPEKEYWIDSVSITPENASKMYNKYTLK
jgi:ribose transport system substrate-binding protein